MGKIFRSFSLAGILLGAGLLVAADQQPEFRVVQVTSPWVTARNWTLSSGTDSIAAIESGTWNITNITGTVSLPTGASTSANQTSEITALQILDDVPTAANASFVKGVPVMDQLDDTSPTAATEDAMISNRQTAQRAKHVNLRNNAGTEIGTATAPVAVQMRNNTSARITGNTTSTVKSGAGVLHAVVINDNTTSGTLTIYDNTSGSGTILFQLECGSPSGGILSSSGRPGPFSTGALGLEFTTGLTVVTSGSTSNDVTIVYK